VESREDQLEAEAKRAKDASLFAKKLELEHIEKKEIIHWTIWAILLVVTAGIVSVLFGGLAGQESDAVRSTVNLNISLVSILALVGLWLGVIAPVSLHLGFIRELIGKLATK